MVWYCSSLCPAFPPPTCPRLSFPRGWVLFTNYDKCEGRVSRSFLSVRHNAYFTRSLNQTSSRFPADCNRLRGIESPYWDDSRPPVQEIPRILWNPKVHYYVHNNSPLDPILSHWNSVHTLRPYFFQTNFNIILPSTPGYPKWPIRFRIINYNLYAFLIPRSRCMSCPSYCPWFYHPNSICWRVQIMKLIIILRILFSNTLNLCSSLTAGIHTHKKQRVKLFYVYISLIFLRPSEWILVL
jgi:hypothetical protein